MSETLARILHSPSRLVRELGLCTHVLLFLHCLRTCLSKKSRPSNPPIGHPLKRHVHYIYICITHLHFDLSGYKITLELCKKYYIIFASKGFRSSPLRKMGAEWTEIHWLLKTPVNALYDILKRKNTLLTQY